MKCPRCLNTNPDTFYLGSKGWYCRACVSFKRQLYLDELALPQEEPLFLEHAEYELDFQLSDEQIVIGQKLAELCWEKDVLLYAVCGAGKTEMLLPMIEQMLKKGKRVAIAIPRRQVVLELTQRLQSYFKSIQVTPLCEGYTQVVSTDLIVCTTHQLYRFPQTFDLLIIDEPDAFPYKDNLVLQGIAKTSCRGHFVYCTATPLKWMRQEVQASHLVELRLLKRPHGHPLMVPSLTVLPKWLCLLDLLRWLHQEHNRHKQALIFVPTRVMASQLGRFLKVFYSVGVCTSKTEKKDEVIERFRSHQDEFCVCTSILERGVTFTGIDVAVFWADHAVFDEASLIQIAGRVGRKKEAWFGECRFYASSQKETVHECIQRIQEANLSWLSKK